MEFKYDMFRGTSWVADKLPIGVSYTVANRRGRCRLLYMEDALGQRCKQYAPGAGAGRPLAGG